MLWIERPSGKDIRDERVELTIRDENGLRAATIFVSTRLSLQSRASLHDDRVEEIVIKVDRPVGETSRCVVEL